MKHITEVVRDIAKRNDWRITKADQEEMRWVEKWERKADMVMGSKEICKMICREARESMGEDQAKMKRWVAIEYCSFPIAVQNAKVMIDKYFEIKSKMANED